MPEGSILVSDLASERGTDGVVDHGTLEEEAPATWEALVLPADVRDTGNRYALRRAEPPSMQVRPVLRIQIRMARRSSIGLQVGAPRENRRSIDEAGDSDDRIVAMKSGNGWHRSRAPKPAEQRRSVLGENIRKEP